MKDRSRWRYENDDKRLPYSKNEENVLAEDVLTSLKDIADEMVIVDTGSTDGTKEAGLAFHVKNI